MDDLVKQAILRWPNVPAITGWLKLSRRGEWLLTGEVAEGLPITHERMRRFIDRNYERDEQGQWYFQNGPQKVYVSLDYTPLVFGVHKVDDAYCLVAHTRAVALPVGVFMDEEGVVLFDTPMGVGLVQNADVDLLASMIAPAPDDPDSLLLQMPWALPAAANCADQEWRLPVDAPAVPKGSLPVETISRVDVPKRFAYVSQPSL